MRKEQVFRIVTLLLCASKCIDSYFNFNHRYTLDSDVIKKRYGCIDMESFVTEFIKRESFDSAIEGIDNSLYKIARTAVIVSRTFNIYFFDSLDGGGDSYFIFAKPTKQSLLKLSKRIK